jgi:hypothetical protein
MKRRFFIIIVSVSVCILCGLVVGMALFFVNAFSNTNDRDNDNPEKQEEMLMITLEWGRLAPIPDSKSEYQIRTEGSAFTRSFRSSFYLPEEDLYTWINDSPGIQDAEIEVINGNKNKYVIHAGGGASYGEVIIDFDRGFVETYVCWS